MIKRKFAVIHLGILMIATLGLLIPVNQVSAFEEGSPSIGPGSALTCNNVYLDLSDGNSALFQQFGDYILNGESVTGVEIQLDAKRTDGDIGTATNLVIQLSPFASASNPSTEIGESETTVTAGGQFDLWGLDWDETILANGNLFLEVTAMVDDGGTINLDCVKIIVYTTSDGGDPVCGDGVQEGAEECDDGNNVDGDSCTAACVVEFCGDDTVNDSGAEECDDGNNVDADACSNSCTLPVCGDGATAGAEECDDGNNVDADACSNSCTLLVCGDGETDEGNVCNTPPVALVTDVIVSANASCQADTSIDDGSFDPDGDDITLTQVPSGPYPLGDTEVELTVSDGQESDSASATVTVNDTTSPEITAPADISQGATGPLTEVDIGEATASDNCSVIITNDAPASFAPGTTTVTWSATDGSGNVSTATQDITILAPRELKAGAIDDLESLQSSLNGKGKEKMDEAIYYLTESIFGEPEDNEEIWIDGLHLVADNGDDFYGTQNDAAEKLMEILEKPGEYGASSVSADIVDIIENKILQADRVLAQVVIDEAAGGDSSLIDEAEEQMDKAADEIASGEYDKAIEYYYKAWESALKAAGIL